MTKEHFMELVPYLLMGVGLSIVFLELIKVFQ